MATKPGAKKLIKGTPKTLPLSVPMANDNTNKKSKADTKGEKIVFESRHLKISKLLFGIKSKLQPNLLIQIFLFLFYIFL